MGRAHPVGVCFVPVGEGLSLVVVFLLTKAKQRKGSVDIGQCGKVLDVVTSDRGEAEVASNDRQWH
jgi:hypothetical protein